MAQTLRDDRDPLGGWTSPSKRVHRGSAADDRSRDRRARADADGRHGGHRTACRRRCTAARSRRLAVRPIEGSTKPLPGRGRPPGLRARGVLRDRSSNDGREAWRGSRTLALPSEDGGRVEGLGTGRDLAEHDRPARGCRGTARSQPGRHQGSRIRSTLISRRMPNRAPAERSGHSRRTSRRARFHCRDGAITELGCLLG